jgi:hypothetical protein
MLKHRKGEIIVIARKGQIIQSRIIKSVNNTTKL